MITKCQICGKEFKTLPCRLRQGIDKFCSHTCYGKWFSLNRSKTNNSNWKEREKKHCFICNKMIYILPSLVKKGRGKFCSRKCEGIWLSQQHKGMNSVRWKGGKAKRICQTCKKEFLIYNCPSVIKNGYGKFCSQKCSHIQHKKKRGDKSPNWKGGITPIHISIRSSQKYYEWRKAIFKKDNFICQKCGDKRGGNLHAHHLKKFSIILNDIKQKYPLLSIADIAENYPDLWNLKNGITLCEKCHIKIHRKSKEGHHND